MSPETTAAAEGRPRTIVGLGLDGLGFWLFLCMLEGFAFTVWVLLEIQNHYYFTTMPFGVSGMRIPW